MKIFDFIFNSREICQRLGMNQEEFLTRIGVTHSGGSRYGRSMPRPVRELLRLVHVEQIDLSTVKKEDFEIIEHMSAHRPQLYQCLRRAVRAKRRKPEDARH